MTRPLRIQHLGTLTLRVVASVAGVLVPRRPPGGSLRDGFRAGAGNWRLIHKSNLMTVTTPSPSDVSVTL